MRRRLGFRSAGRRRRPPGAWTGRTDLSQQLTTASDILAFNLWDDQVSARLNAGGKCYHRVTHLHFGVRGPSVVPAAGQSVILFAWYLYVFTTDDLNNVVPAAIFDPLNSGPQVHEKALMDLGMRTYAPPAGTSHDAYTLTMEREVKAIRKFDDTDAMVLVVQAANMDAAAPLIFDVMARSYIQWR